MRQCCLISHRYALAGYPTRGTWCIGEAGVKRLALDRKFPGRQ